MPLSETLAQGLAKRVTYLFNDCMSKSLGKSKDFLRTRPAGNCSPQRGPHRSCDSALCQRKGLAPGRRRLCTLGGHWSASPRGAPRTL